MTDSHAPEPDHVRPDDSIGRIAELIGGDPMARIDADMNHVLDRLAEMGARPLERLSPETARRQPRGA